MTLIDLNVPGNQIPELVIVDTNIIVERLLASYPVPASMNSTRAITLFRHLSANNGVGLVTPVAFIELIHVAIRTRYEQAIPSHLGVLATAYGSRPNKKYRWIDLFKLDATILQRSGPYLEQLRQLLVANNLLFVGPEDLGAIPSGKPFDEEIVSMAGQYGLDTSDAAILLDARRLGILDIVTLDADLRRAQADFNIFAWI
jgi:predicted nucleic acid-binding protein